VQSVFGPQSRAQLPQVVGLVSTASHPSSAMPLQSANPASHTQLPLLHAWCAPHLIPHPPQFFTSREVSISQPFGSAPSQSAVPAGQTQRPALQVWPFPHNTPQPPQFVGSIAASVSQPVRAF